MLLPTKAKLSRKAVIYLKRIVLVADRGENKPVYCAEPSPDALTAVAAAFGAGLALPEQAQREIAVGFN